MFVLGILCIVGSPVQLLREVFSRLHFRHPCSLVLSSYPGNEVAFSSPTHISLALKRLLTLRLLIRSCG